MHARIVMLACGWALAAALAEAAGPLRYVAMLANGERVQGDRLSGWHDPNGVPQLSGRPLLAQDNPFRWLRDRAHELADVPPAYIEFHNGDRLPGTVIDYRTGLENAYDPQPPHFVVRVAVEFEPPENRPVTEIRVMAAWARRIVWQRRGSAAPQAGAALFRDGRNLPYRAVRFHAGEAHLLMEGGDERVSWNDLAELHLPPVDPWTAHFDELAALCTTTSTRLIEIETSAGLIATASLARLAPRFEGNSSDPDRWAHGVQPAWSLDILWIPFRQIACYRTFASREVPLSRIAPRQVQQRGGLGGRRAAERNRSVLGTPLASQAVDFGFGWGAWGGSELTFELPPGVRSLRCQVCLDRAASNGGCIRPRILANDTGGRLLWEGPILVGSSQIADTGVIGLGGPAAGQHAIVLQIDAVASGRPAGADPLDIRDYGDWCETLLELDPAVVQTQLDLRLPRRFAAWRDWQVRIAGGGTPAEAGLEATFHFDPRRPALGEIETAIQVTQRPLIVSREVAVGPRDQWLLIAATRPISRGREPKLEVRIGGEAVAEFTVPERQHDPNDSRPLAVSLSAYATNPPRKLRIEIQQATATDSAPVHYRSLAVVEQLPTLYRAFEDQGAFRPIEAGQSGSATLANDDRHFGRCSLRVLPSGRFRLTLPAPISIRERPGWGEARFIRFAVKKQGGGRVAVEVEDAQFREQAARYDLGPGQPSYGSATRIWQDNLPKDWVVLTRDLFADFGNVDARALIVGAPDGEAALIDHVYLARNQSDFELIPAASPALVNEKAVLEMLKPVAQRVLPAVVWIEFEGGQRAAGVLIDEREILTAGHAVFSKDRDCRVLFADGKSAAAKTLGVARDFDLGLVRITAEGRYPRVEAHGPAELPQNQPYLAFAFDRQNIAQPQLAHIRRVFRSTVWTDLEPEVWVAGGPLFDQGGRLIAVQVSRSQFGGVNCTRLQEAWNHLGRMRSGEVFGTWPAGSEGAPR